MRFDGVIQEVFNEVVAIFDINEKDADEKGLWKKFEWALKKILGDDEMEKDKLLYEILVRIYNIFFVLIVEVNANHRESISKRIKELGHMIEKFEQAIAILRDAGKLDK